MRVIAGQYRSRPLRSLRGMDIRPTSDRLRETLFDVLTAGRPEALRDTVWLDLFAGTGAVGIEALSRGAREVHFVETSTRAAAVIRENLRGLAIDEGFEIHDREVERALRLLDSEAIVCDFCFLDPPYRMQQAYAATLGFLSQSRLLRRDSTVIAEHEKRFDPGARFGALQRFRLLRQGDAALSFYRLGA
ncbi:MAG: 16S rRNA (guanine(966)-N(2))-methyltransferase RsmD [Terriglobales bacterium]